MGGFILSDRIKLNTEVLTEQSSRMKTLSSDYQELFQQVRKSLKLIDNSFSSKMSREFVVKINTAQKSFDSIVQSIQNGANAAMLGVKAFNETGSVNMGSMLETSTKNAELSRMMRSINTGFPDEVYETARGFLKDHGIDGKHIIPILEKIESADYSEALKIYDRATEKVSHLISDELKDKAPAVGKLAETLGWGAVEEGINSTLYHIPRDLGKAYSLMLSDDTTVGDAAKLYGEVLWHWGGAPLEGALNQATKISSELYPEGIEYLESLGADPNNGASLVSHSFGSVIAEFTKDDSWNETYSIFDKGMGKGLMDAFEDIGSYGVDKANELIDNIGLHSIFK